jgi:capsular exopolysaccharide synthesis family protein
MIDEPMSVVAEQYRTIRTNIQFSSVDKIVKTIMVTSANMSEGKSTTVSNLAVAFAQQGKKVLLIDADLRKPTLQYVFNLKNSVGLSSVLSWRSQLADSINNTHIPDLDVITSGPIPPNPSELLGSNSMKSLLTTLKSSYEIILIDSPPLLPVTDAKVLGGIVDGLILVLKSGSTEIEDVKKVKAMIDGISAKILGTILNKKKVKTSHDYGYYQNG